MNAKIQRFERLLRHAATFARVLATELQPSSPWIAASMRRLATDLDRHRAELRELLATQRPSPERIGDVIDRVMPPIAPEGTEGPHDAR